jgi:hypothetical protein
VAQRERAGLLAATAAESGEVDDVVIIYLFATICRDFVGRGAVAD